MVAGTQARVSLDRPDLTIHVEVLPRDIYFSYGREAGPGGLPVGVSGNVVVLLSGGIDSPVAAHRLMKRGCRAVFVHFHSFPFQDATSRAKAADLVQCLTRFQYHSRLYLVPFGEVQREIVAGAPGPLRVVLYRRFMARIAAEIARREDAKALVTGESLGQVASQTLENLAVIEEAVEMPVLRPLIGSDKEEIVQQARALGSYQISILPDQDCCSLFVPRHPATFSTLAEIRQAESRLDVATSGARGGGAGGDPGLRVSRGGPRSAARGHCRLRGLSGCRFPCRNTGVSGPAWKEQSWNNSSRH